MKKHIVLNDILMFQPLTSISLSDEYRQKTTNPHLYMCHVFAYCSLNPLLFYLWIPKRYEAINEKAVFIAFLIMTAFLMFFMI